VIKFTGKSADSPIEVLGELRKIKDTWKPPAKSTL